MQFGMRWQSINSDWRGAEMLYYVNLMARVDGALVTIATDVEAKNGADAIVKILGGINNPNGSIESISIICHADPEGTCK